MQQTVAVREIPYTLAASHEIEVHRWLSELIEKGWRLATLNGTPIAGAGGATTAIFYTAVLNA